MREHDSQNLRKQRPGYAARLACSLRNRTRELVHDIRIGTDPDQMTCCVNGNPFTLWEIGHEPINMVHRRHWIFHIVEDECGRLQRTVGPDDYFVGEHDKVVLKPSVFRTLSHRGERCLTEALCRRVTGNIRVSVTGFGFEKLFNAHTRQMKSVEREQEFAQHGVSEKWQRPSAGHGKPPLVIPAMKLRTQEHK